MYAKFFKRLIDFALSLAAVIVLFPVLLVTLQQLNDRGLVRLWKSI